MNGAVIEQQAHPLLRDRRELGRGSNSTVFEGRTPSTVYKVTWCPATHAFHTAPDRPQGSHFPHLIHAHGPIGRHPSRYPIYLVELERLTPLPLGSEALALAQRIVAGYAACCRDWAFLMADMGNVALEALVRSRILNESINEALGVLSEFVGRIHALPDLMDLGNLMMRADGTVVFSDPVFVPLPNC